MPGPTLMTTRTRLRAWRESDLSEFARLNADPAVVEFLPGPLDRARSDAMATFHQRNIEARGFGFWAVEVPGVAPFVGFVGLSVPSFRPEVEIGWRLAREHWGQGYTTEAARAALAYGFGELGLEEIVAFTVPANVRSRRVMERLGMSHDPADDFEHPSLPEGHPLRPHVLYRLRT